MKGVPGSTGDTDGAEMEMGAVTTNSLAVMVTDTGEYLGGRK